MYNPEAQRRDKTGDTPFGGRIAPLNYLKPRQLLHKGVSIN